ncbi:gamma-glutamylcyclotransferase [Bradyrhizobium sp. WSM 1744]|uniref:Gamma-glutamylcyclotransferase n=1 Tax=Bradyrhizobium archetypum TaxID=2721160 RepID=A0A7Y4H901_9BRAD|nr:gamma-glutamylcyclotransferase [Bradyrhizobium archetypum]
MSKWRVTSVHRLPRGEILKSWSGHEIKTCEAFAVWIGVGELPLAETARMIASGKGVLGTNREYLVQLATQLEALDIEDPYVAQLYAQMDAGPAA